MDIAQLRTETARLIHDLKATGFMNMVRARNVADGLKEHGLDTAALAMRQANATAWSRRRRDRQDRPYSDTTHNADSVELPESTRAYVLKTILTYIVPFLRPLRPTKADIVLAAAKARGLKKAER